MGGCVGFFIKNVRIADINIVAAEWAGYGSRTDTNHREQTRAIIASTDPVALDYIGARDVLMPATLKNAKESSWVVHNNPEIEHSSFRQFLQSCHEIGIGNLGSNNINVINYTFT